MHKYEALVLKALKQSGELSFDGLMEKTGLGRSELLWALENLKQNGSVELESSEKATAKIGDEGKAYSTSGLPEEKLLEKLEKGAVRVSALKSGEEQIGIQWLKKKGLADIKNGMLSLTASGINALGKGIEESGLLRKLAGNPDSYATLYKEHTDALRNLMSRKLITVENRRSIERIRITKKGLASAPSVKEASLIDAIDRSIIMGRRWPGKEFKQYNVNVAVESANAARRHPLRRLVGEIKDAYLSMGFQEIHGPAVESAFWVFDSLFMPQDHPARDAQDTFYISNPSTLKLDDAEYVRSMKRAHEAGWHEQWDIDAARQTVLRTHMTSVSARYVRNVIKRMLLKEQLFDMPVKLFSVGRTFRNENVDYKHLADFYQMDGVIIGKELTLSHLFDTLTKIYKRLGVEIRFKPSYFPFVEPGVEYLAYHKASNSWVEMGGAGLIRNEITGIRKKSIQVLAWGAGVERLMLMRDSSIGSIAELYGNSIGWLRKRRMM
ncbi:MAG: phenylalanine--tRNA ligase subunit alpha [Candidatus Micrarchaeota archaeon]|nr:phenylalanine--tRNA ligase subunit alpha [Candidatus Micrarchaeota archaeon]